MRHNGQVAIPNDMTNLIDAWQSWDRDICDYDAPHAEKKKHPWAMPNSCAT
jgi:hypothetical protein